MAITLGRNRTPFEGLLRWFDDDLFTADFARTLTPALDVEEKGDRHLLKADLPGMKKADMHVELRDGMLTLHGERRDERQENKGGYRRTERTYGSFSRSFRVPEGVTEKGIQATYRDGVLELSIPAPKASEPRAIDVTVE